MTSILITDRRGLRHRGEGHVKTEAQTELYSHKPRNAWSHQKLEEARRILP